MAVAGTLEIQMLANMARLSDDMRQAQRTVGTAMAGIEKSVATAKAALGALGIGLGVGMFASLIKGSIDAMDKLRDLSKTTNIAVESLAGLQMAAKQSGGDLNSIADSINKLSQNMGKDAEKFRTLGVTAKDPLEAFKQLADIYTKLEDPQQRAAVMAQALGKSWAGAAPLLAEGSAKIQEMVDKGKLLSGVTKEMTEEADKFNDQMVELNTTLGATLTRAVGPMLPQMNEVAKAMSEAAKEGGLLLTIWVALGGAMATILNLNLPAAMKIQAEINALTDDAERLSKALSNITSSVNPGVRDRLEDQLRIIKARLELLKHERTLMETPPAVPVAGDKATAAAAAGFLGDKDKDKDAERIGRQLQEGMDIEAQQMAEAAQLTDDFRRREREQEQAHQDLRNQILIEAYDREQAEAIANGEAQLEIDRTIAQQKKLQQATELQGRNNFMNNMSGLMNTQSKKLFEIGKIFAISDALLKGYSAVLDSYAFGAKIGGPLLGAAFAAAAGLATLNMINNIRAQKFGGGGGVPTAPTQGASNISPVGAGGAEKPSASQTTIVNFMGGSASERDLIRRFADMLNENSVDGGRVILAQP